MSDLQSPSLSAPADPTASARLISPASTTLGHVLAGMAADYEPVVRLEDVHLIRHTFKPKDPRSLHGPEDLTEERVLAYTREQDLAPRFPSDPPRYWVIFIADGKRRARLWGTYENRGEIATERTEVNRYFDLRPAGFLTPLKDRLVVDWDNPRSWHRKASSATAARMPVLEIADQDKISDPIFGL